MPHKPTNRRTLLRPYHLVFPPVARWNACGCLCDMMLFDSSGFSHDYYGPWIFVDLHQPIPIVCSITDCPCDLSLPVRPPPGTHLLKVHVWRSGKPPSIFCVSPSWWENLCWERMGTFGVGNTTTRRDGEVEDGCIFEPPTWHAITECFPRTCHLGGSQLFRWLSQ